MDRKKKKRSVKLTKVLKLILGEDQETYFPGYQSKT